MGKQTLSSPPPSEPVSQFLRSVEKIRLAQESGQDPGQYEANARQWLAIVKLTHPQEAKTLELELNRTVGHRPAEENSAPAAPGGRWSVRRIAWLCVPVAIMFTVVGPNIIVRVVAFVSLACLLAVILVIWSRQP